jgi:hypothetical protein
VSASTRRFLVVAVLPGLLALAGAMLLAGCGGQAGVGVGYASYVPYDEQFGTGFFGEFGEVPFGFGEEEEEEGGEREGEEGERDFDRDIHRGGAEGAPGSVTESIALPGSSPLTYAEVRMGEGPAARAGDTVDIGYDVRLATGKKLTSSQESGTALRLTIGRSRDLMGWDRGLVGMAPGGVRRLFLPSQAVRTAGHKVDRVLGVLPPDSALVVEVEMLAVRRPTIRG